MVMFCQTNIFALSVGQVEGMMAKNGHTKYLCFSRFTLVCLPKPLFTVCQVRKYVPRVPSTALTKENQLWAGHLFFDDFRKQVGRNKSILGFKRLRSEGTNSCFVINFPTSIFDDIPNSES